MSAPPVFSSVVHSMLHSSYGFLEFFVLFLEFLHQDCFLFPFGWRGHQTAVRFHFLEGWFRGDSLTFILHFVLEFVEFLLLILEAVSDDLFVALQATDSLAQLMSCFLQLFPQFLKFFLPCSGLLLIFFVLELCFFEFVSVSFGAISF